MMSTKHYVAIARAIKGFELDDDYPEFTNELVDIFAEDNDRFDASTFYEACGRTYQIVRFHEGNGSPWSEVVEDGCSLDEAQAYCSRPDTKGEGWFCGYTREAS
jgi:hypothetical protein